MSDVVLEVTDARKRFGDVVALDGVGLECRRGEIHALLGENGAGKSTLMHVVSGLLSADGGHVRLEGSVVRWRSADEARSAGIAMVHQHFMLVPTMTISENLALARQAFGLVAPASLDAEVRRLAAERRIDVGDPRRCVEELSVGEQQRVEILKALVDVPALLILDEPTAVLTPSEVDDLFALLRDLASQGTAIIIVTHKLAEVFAIADRVSVLRRGALVASGPASAFDRDSLARRMVGDQEIDAAPTSARRPGPERLRARGLRWTSADGRVGLDGVDLEVRAGEIVAVAGVEGNGQQELQSLLSGVRSADVEGEVHVDGKLVASATDARDAGVAIVPADRRRDGLVAEMPLWENLLLGHEDLRRAAPRGWLVPSEQSRRARPRLEAFSVRPADPDLPAGALSGGNQQRLVLARELGRDGLSVVIATSPTRGLDLVATRAVHARLRDLARRGAAVLVLSTDLDEVEALADRVAVLYRGRVRSIEGDAIDRTEIGRRMAGLEGAP